MESERIEYAKQLADEWRYRHETFLKLLFRYSWIAVLLAILPAFAVDSPIGAEFFQHVRGGGHTSVVYWAFVLAFFAASNWHLSTEYMGSEGVRDKLKEIRGKQYMPQKISIVAFLKRAWLKQAIYVLAFLAFFWACGHYQRGEAPDSPKTTSAQPRS